MDPLTKEQAERIGDIAGRADGGCTVCVAHLVEMLRDTWPEHDWAKYADISEEYLD